MKWRYKSENKYNIGFEKKIINIYRRTIPVVFTLLNETVTLHQGFPKEKHYILVVLTLKINYNIFCLQ